MEKVLLIDGNRYSYTLIPNGDTIMELNGTTYKINHIVIDDISIRDTYTYINYLRSSKTIIELVFEFIGGGKNE